jgi:hypothetical protein
MFTCTLCGGRYPDSASTTTSCPLCRVEEEPDERDYDDEDDNEENIQQK